MPRIIERTSKSRIKELEHVQSRGNDNTPASQHPKNLISLVVSKKQQNDLPDGLRESLIAYTEQLAENARNGTLKGIVGCAEYEHDYEAGMEGSYFLNPRSAITPLEILKWRIMRHVESEE